MSMEGLLPANHQLSKQRLSPQKSLGSNSHLTNKQNQVGTVLLYGIPIVSLVIDSQERLCLAQISNTLLKQYSYNEIHNRRVALGITCVQCTPVQLEILRRAGAMPVSSRRCGMITRREAERLCKSFLGDNAPPRLPDDFAFSVHHECAWGCRGAFLPSRYNSSRAKCIKCSFCGLFFSPNKFIFHSHRTSSNATYVQPDAANFNSWRRHMKLSGSPPDDVVHAWEDVKAMFNGGTRKRLLASSSSPGSLPMRSTITTTVPITIATTPTKQIKLDTSTSTNSPYPTPSNTPIPVPTPPRVPPFPDLALPISMMDYVWHNGVNVEGVKHQFPFTPYAVPWFGNAKRSVLGLSTLSAVSPQQESLLQHLCPPNSTDKMYHHSAFRPVFPAFGRPDVLVPPDIQNNIIKRQMDSEELLLPKKKYSREPEKMDNVSMGNDPSKPKGPLCRSDVVDKENDSRKNGDGYAQPYRNGSPESPRTINFKREYNETSNDSEELPKARPPEGKDLLEVSRLLSMKPNLVEESMFKFREFSPNLLEAISNLKTEERGGYSGLAVKMYRSAVDMEREYAKRRETQMVDEEEEESRNGSRSEEEDDDETVDVETTDDVPVDDIRDCKDQEAFEANSSDKMPLSMRMEEEGRPSTRSPEPGKTNRIWTIARFSLEEPDSGSHPTDFCYAGEHGVIYKSRREMDNMKGNLCDHKKPKPPECLSCCQVAFGNG